MHIHVLKRKLSKNNSEELLLFQKLVCIQSNTILNYSGNMSLITMYVTESKELKSNEVNKVIEI